jgi:hypothetical protein
VADFGFAVVVSPFQTNGKPLSSGQKRISEIDVDGDNKLNINLTALSFSVTKFKHTKHVKLNLKLKQKTFERLS